MILKEFSPGTATRDTVRVYRVIHFAAANRASAVKVYPPMPEQCLQLFVHEPETVEYPDGRRLQWRCVLAGAHDITVRRIVPARFLMIQAVFEPGALYRLTGIPGTELQNAYLDAEAVFGTAVRRLRESLEEEPSYVRMIARVDDYIANLVAQRKAVHPVEPLLRWLRDGPGASVDQVAAQCSLSVRQFERSCLQRTGMGPRELASLARFDRAFHAKLQRPGLDWLSIAIASGYYDYQHMARDFRLFAGLTPPRLLDTQRSSPEHLLGIKHEFDLTYPASA
jgi:methylphosphotriester-DNA--protein-cysteine methyltransferase